METKTFSYDDAKFLLTFYSFSEYGYQASNPTGNIPCVLSGRRMRDSSGMRIPSDVQAHPWKTGPLPRALPIADFGLILQSAIFKLPMKESTGE
jgi:hypothetical protein